MKTPLVSIVVPTYNQEKMISRCIESVLCQTYNNWELIIIDDASKDGTREVLKKYSSAEERIKVICNSVNNGMHGLYKNYNKGLAIAEGVYVAILEGDDFWHREKLERQVRKLEKKPSAVLCYTNIKVVDNAGCQLYTSRLHWKNAKKVLNNVPVGIKFVHFLTLENRVPSITVMVRKEALIEIGGFCKLENVGTVDYPTLFFLIEKGEFCFIKKALAFSVRHGDNYSLGKVEEFQKGFIDLTVENFENYQGKWEALGVKTDKLLRIQEKILEKKLELNNCKDASGVIASLRGLSKRLRLRLALQICKYSLFKNPSKFFRI